MVVAKGTTETNAECFVFNVVFPRVSNLVDESREGELKGGKVIRWRLEESGGVFTLIVSQVVDVHNQSRLFPPQHARNAVLVIIEVRFRLEEFLENTGAISHEIIWNDHIIEERHRRRWRSRNTSVA